MSRRNDNGQKNRKIEEVQEEFFDEESRLRRQCNEKIDEKTQQEEGSRRGIEIEKRRDLYERINEEAR